MTSRFEFDSQGIGDLLKGNRFVVPPNQRPYAWRELHVRTFLEDLNEAISNGDEDYFLGTIVLVQQGKETPSIADGQQRLATTSMILARIRDLLFELGRSPGARSIDLDFIRSIDRVSEIMVPHLSLNLEDNDFFSSSILTGPMDDGYANGTFSPQRSSNKRLQEASAVISEFLKNIIEGLPISTRASYLLKWVDYIQKHTGVIIVKVPDEVGAYRMFETLNDRGLKASQADILKNYLYSRAGDRLSEVMTSWTNIGASVEVLSGDENERLITYIRHHWITTNGPTKERELAAEIRKVVTSQSRAMNFIADAGAAVQDYIALWSGDHPKWQSYPPSVRRNVGTLSEHLQVEQIRPLLFAVTRHFDPTEAEKAFRLFVSWSVRFLIFGGRGGLLDTQYSLRAADVGTKKITKATELREAMREYVPSDAEFQQAFSAARVSRQHLARYYLRALEKTAKGEDQPEYVANEEVTEVNLEHVLPLTPSASWQVDPEAAKAAQKRLGNMALMKADKNRDIGNKDFDTKKTFFRQSSYKLTSDIASYAKWQIDEIEQRQRILSELAVKTWPLTFG